MMSLPHVTCLCITRNRRGFLPRAIECFERQTYPRKELLIVADGESVADLVPGDGNVRHVEVIGAPRIGAKRNLGCGLATHSEVIMHWDDDDYSLPNRITEQTDALLRSSKSVTGYRNMYFTDGRSWWLYEGEPGYVVGTSLCYLRSWWSLHRFEDVQVAEDNQFVYAAHGQNQLCAAPGLAPMYATIHPGNTSKREMGANFKPALAPAVLQTSAKWMAA